LLLHDARSAETIVLREGGAGGCAARLLREETGAATGWSAKRWLLLCEGWSGDVGESAKLGDVFVGGSAGGGLVSCHAA